MIGAKEPQRLVVIVAGQTGVRTPVTVFGVAVRWRLLGTDSG